MSSVSGISGRTVPSGSRNATAAPSVSCPSRNTVALIWKVSPAAAFAGHLPQSTTGTTFSIRRATAGRSSTTATSSSRKLRASSKAWGSARSRSPREQSRSCARKGWPTRALPVAAGHRRGAARDEFAPVERGYANAYGQSVRIFRAVPFRVSVAEEALPEQAPTIRTSARSRPEVHRLPVDCAHGVGRDCALDCWRHGFRAGHRRERIVLAVDRYCGVEVADCHSDRQGR